MSGPTYTDRLRQENIALRARIAELEAQNANLLLYAQMACSKCQHNVHLKKLEMRGGMTPTHEQIEAAAEIICRGRCDCRLADLPAKKPPFSGVDTADDFRAIAKLALTAAAEVGDTQERLLRHGREVFDATIERCAQVAANFDDGNPVAVEIAAAIRALKKG